MKLIKISALTIAVLFANSAIAEDQNKNEGGWAANIGISGVLLRNYDANQNGVFAGVWYSRYNNQYGSSSSNHANQLGIEVGYRSYLKTTDLRKFIDTSLSYTKYDTSTSGNDTHYNNISLGYGLEKHIIENLSIEGSAGISVWQSHGRNSESLSIHIPATNIAINYYF